MYNYADDSFDREDAEREAYLEHLKKFYYATTNLDKDWEDLNGWQIAQIERDYHAEREAAERWLNPNDYFGVGGTR